MNTPPIRAKHPIQLFDLWKAYARGAREVRDSHIQPTDKQIDRACDAYVKLFIEKDNG